MLPVGASGTSWSATTTTIDGRVECIFIFRSKGFGFVTFERRDDAEAAYEKYATLLDLPPRFNGYEIHGRALRLDWDLGRGNKPRKYSLVISPSVDAVVVVVVAEELVVVTAMMTETAMTAVTVMTAMTAMTAMMIAGAPTAVALVVDPILNFILV